MEIDGISFIDFPCPEALPYLEADAELTRYAPYLIENCTGELAIGCTEHDLAGYVFVKQDKEKGFIFDLYVNPIYRHRGIGSRLLDDAISVHGGTDLLVDADNEVAIGMYERRGFWVLSEKDGKRWMGTGGNSETVNEMISVDTRHRSD